MKLNHIISAPVTNSSAVVYTRISDDALGVFKQSLIALSQVFSEEDFSLSEFQVIRCPPPALVLYVSKYSMKLFSESDCAYAQSLSGNEKLEFVEDLIIEKETKEGGFSDTYEYFYAETAPSYRDQDAKEEHLVQWQVKLLYKGVVIEGAEAFLSWLLHNSEFNLIDEE